MRGRRSIRSRSEGLAAVKRVLVYSLWMFILAIAESSFFAGIRILPATPDLILAAVAVIAVTDTRECAAASGIIGGVMADAIGGVGVYLSPMFYLAVAVVTALLSKKMMSRYMSWLALFPIALIMRGMLTAAICYFVGGGSVFSEVLTGIILPEAIVTLIAALPLYPLIRVSILPLGGRWSAELR